jgi:hypothetical protein
VYCHRPQDRFGYCTETKNERGYLQAKVKIQIGEDADYDKVIARYRSEEFGDEVALAHMKIVPVNFNKKHKAYLVIAR